MNEKGEFNNEPNKKEKEAGYESLEERKEKLITKAKKQYGKIFPCVNKKSLEESFTSDKAEKLMFWFNTEDNSTRIVKEDL